MSAIPGNTDDGGLDGREAAALLLALGRSVRAAADAAGCSERTVRNWRQEEAFQARVRTLRSDVFGRAVGNLTAASVRAARTLAKLLKSSDERIQLGAARAVLESCPRLVETADLAARLEALEARFSTEKRR